MLVLVFAVFSKHFVLFLVEFIILGLILHFFVQIDRIMGLAL
jgi:hypothetical protein